MIAYIEGQGSLLHLRLMGQPSKAPNMGSVRGRIMGFSRKSRTRLLRLFARMRMKNVRATFITLTFARYPTNKQAKTALKRFIQHVRDNYEDVSMVWRVEYQKRGSVHFHLLAYALPYWDWKEVLQVWKRCSNQTKARIDIRLCHSKRSVMSYVSKYIAKPSKGIGKTFFIHAPYQQKGRHWRKGRQWGYVNKKSLPFDDVVEGLLTDEKAIKRLSNSAWEIIGTDERYGSLSFHLFYDNAKALAMRNIEAFGRRLDEWEYTIKDHKRHPSPYERAEDHFSEQQLEIPRRLVIGRIVKGERSEIHPPLTMLRPTASYRLVVETGELLERVRV